MLKRINSTSTAASLDIMSGTKMLSTLEGKWVHTMTFTAPNRETKGPTIKPLSTSRQ